MLFRFLLIIDSARYYRLFKEELKAFIKFNAEHPGKSMFEDKHFNEVQLEIVWLIDLIWDHREHRKALTQCAYDLKRVA